MADGEIEREPTERDEAVTADTVVAETVTPESVRVRRSPRYARFMIVGVIVCAIVAFILTYSLPQGAGYDRNSVFGYMLLVSIAVGVTLGAVAALIAERITSRSARTVAADRVDVVVTESAESAELDGRPEASYQSSLGSSSAAAGPGRTQATGRADGPDTESEPRDT